MYAAAFARSKGSLSFLSPPCVCVGRSSTCPCVTLMVEPWFSYTRARSCQTCELRKGARERVQSGDYDILRLEWLDTSSRGTADGRHARMHAPEQCRFLLYLLTSPMPRPTVAIAPVMRLLADRALFSRFPNVQATSSRLGLRPVNIV